jgi:hypothetical protein
MYWQFSDIFFGKGIIGSNLPDRMEARFKGPSPSYMGSSQYGISIKDRPMDNLGNAH